ncbi:MAG: hypothetical protein OXB96_03200 [Candidatus Kaiserbacteria bacterium]|nr:hypothetical protein [Candidatus Kaiserbacteria bacterium]
MSIDNTVKSFGAAFAFTGIAWLSDVISSGLASLQISIFSTLFGGPQALLTGAVALALAAVDFLLGSDALAYVAGGFTLLLSVQALVSLLTLCVFYAIVCVSPKGTYTLSDCLIAAGVFLLEAMPFLSMFVFWGTFAAYLRRREISGLAGKLSSAVGLDAVGGVGGALQKVLKK